MISKQSVQDIIMQALKNINQERSGNEQIPISIDTCLFGTNSALDSLALVSVIVDVETAISEVSGRDICLTDDRAMNQESSPYSDVGSLTDYILVLLSEPT